MSHAGTTPSIFGYYVTDKKYSQADYPELFNVIGFTYKQQGLLSDAGVAKFAYLICVVEL